jgi:hypothetical protein
MNRNSNHLGRPRPVCTLTGGDEFSMNPSCSTAEKHGLAGIISPCTSLLTTSTPRGGMCRMRVYPLKSKTPQ